MESQKPITVVSGIPRSGTSLAMQMLEAAGLPLLTDDSRPPDRSNPRGYFELGAVKQLERSAEFLSRAPGRAVKIIHLLLPHLPDRYKYRVILMRREMSEILASQKAMLLGQGAGDDRLDDDQLSRVFAEQLKTARDWLAAQPHVEFRELDYNRLLDDPELEVKTLLPLLGPDLDYEAMAGQVAPALCSQRSRS